MKRIKQYIAAFRYKRAVKKANKLARLFGRKYLVINMRGKPVVIAKKRLTELVKKKRFRQGVNAGDIEQNALHVALPKR